MLFILAPFFRGDATSTNVEVVPAAYAAVVPNFNVISTYVATPMPGPGGSRSNFYVVA